MKTTTAPVRSWFYQQALRAIDGTMLSMISDDAASRVVSAPGERQVWLIADIMASDESMLLRWETSKGITVARPMYLAIDKNLPAMLAAIAAAEVNA